MLLVVGGVKAGTGTIQDVQHVVILMQENRSFDHYFGTMRGVRGYNDPNIMQFQNGSSDLFQFYSGNSFGGIHLFLPFAVTNVCINDVDHEEASGLVAWNGGWWNGWMPAKGPGVMAYYSRADLPFYYALADSYTICDANFCSFIGPTFPNRLYLFTGTIDPNGINGGPVLANSDIPLSGLTWTTYPERLQAAGVSWKVYRQPGDWYGDALQWFAQYLNAVPGNPLYDRGLATVSDVVAAFASDVTNGTLPQVSWIIPKDFGFSEHPPYSMGRGEWLVQQLMAAMASNSNVYNSTVFVLTYDENGGFFDHVPSPVSPPGTTNEYIGNSPLGLGVRVPMFIVSPWSRGGRVCSQVFDHTSIIRFLEAWTGVREPNISAWRRQTCGDLTSAFDFAHPDTSIPNLPLMPLQPNVAGVTPPVPTVPTLPVQEPGVRPACPLPYQPNATCYTDCNSNRLFISMTNAGSASVHFAIYPNAYRMDSVWQYDAPPGYSVNDSFVQPLSARGQYDFTCYGPNGFQRRFAGNINRDCNQIEVTSLIDSTAGGIKLGLLNSNTTPVHFTITDNLNSNALWTFNLKPASATNSTYFGQATNNGWYDLTVTADADTNFLRHLAGHIETGAFSFTELPAIVGNTLGISTNLPVNPIISTNTSPGTNGSTTPTITSINDAINQAIAHNSLATAGTNSLPLTLCAFGGSCALIYPGWASNYLAESSVTLNPPAWMPVTATLTVVSNCNVIILPATNAVGFFQLRQQLQHAGTRPVTTKPSTTLSGRHPSPPPRRGSAPVSGGVR